MLPNSLKIIKRHIETGPNATDPADRRIALNGTDPRGGKSGMVWIQVPASGAAVLYVKFGDSSVAIDEASLSTETGAFKLEVGASVVLDTGGNTHVDVYSGSAWDVNVIEVA